MPIVSDILGKRYSYKYLKFNLSELNLTDKTKPIYENIKLENLTDPVMYGKDTYGKYFITVKVFDEKGDIYAQVFYQRYLDYDMWATCKIVDANEFMNISTHILPHQFDVIKRIIRGEVIGRMTLELSSKENVSVKDYINNIRLVTTDIIVYEENSILKSMLYNIYIRTLGFVDGFLWYFGY